LNPLTLLASDEERRLNEHFLNKDGGQERIATIRTEMQTTMEQGVGIYRDEAGLRQTCDTLRQLRERFAHIAIEDRGHVFNTELIGALELDCMLDVAEAVARSALQRQESRGSHTRTDFPDRNDERYLQHSLAYRTPEGPRIAYSPVTITRWEPEERKY
jgi:fumarate reductase flavoprotein subunit